MRIVVLGGGVVGVTTAYQLQRDGHEVVILERRGEVAAGASWGNAGMIAPGHSFAWSSPRAPMILAKSLLFRDQALRFKLSADLRLYAWTWLFLKECTAAKARRNTLLKHRLAAYSQSVLQSVVAEEAIAYDRNRRGILYLHRSRRALEDGVEHMKLLELDGQVIKVWTATRWSRSIPRYPAPPSGSPARSSARPTRQAIARNSPARSPLGSSSGAGRS